MMMMDDSSSIAHHMNHSTTNCWVDQEDQEVSEGMQYQK